MLLVQLVKRPQNYTTGSGVTEYAKPERDQVSPDANAHAVVDAQITLPKAKPSLRRKMRRSHSPKT